MGGARIAHHTDLVPPFFARKLPAQTKTTGGVLHRIYPAGQKAGYGAGFLSGQLNPDSARLFRSRKPGRRTRQGTSHVAGNFQGLAGKSAAQIIERVPSSWKMVPQDRGLGIKFLDQAGFERLRMHGPSARAPSGSNSASGWILRIMDRAGNYYDNVGRIVPYHANEGHIPMSGNLNAP